MVGMFVMRSRAAGGVARRPIRAGQSPKLRAAIASAIVPVLVLAVGPLPGADSPAEAMVTTAAGPGGATSPGRATGPSRPGSPSGPVSAAWAGPEATGSPVAAAVRDGLQQSFARQQRGFFKDGGVLAYGEAPFLGSPTRVRLAAPIVAMAATGDGEGYWLAGADGGVLAYGDARYFGGTGALKLDAPIVDVGATTDGGGYWLVTQNGAVYAFGDARYFGSTGDMHLPVPIVGFASTPDDAGYWLVGSHGEVYTFGDAGYYGSLGGTNLHNIPIVAIASSVDGRGYWLVQGGGEVTAYGDAPRLGHPAHPPVVVGIAVTNDGRGYWLVCGNGQVNAFGDARYLGGNNTVVPRPPISQIVADPAGAGYWLLDSATFPVSLTHPDAASQKAVTIAASQLGPSKSGGNYCSPYGPCEEWCALFATWVWEKAGIPVPRYAFVGDVFNWAAAHTKVMPPTITPKPGDLVFYGTGPQSVSASPHMGVVAQVWPDGAIDTIEGDAGPGPGNWTSVLMNGPFLPSQSFFYNGMPIYAYASTVLRPTHRSRARR
jgi:cell wall-associated NlpC family hydrolase